MTEGAYVGINSEIKQKKNPEWLYTYSATLLFFCRNSN